MTQRGPAEQYEVDVPRPDDFDAFWRETLNSAARIPLRLSLVPVPLRSTPTVDVFEVRYTSLDGVRIAGWYARPAFSYLDPPYPGFIIAPGYISEPKIPRDWARQGYATLSLAPRGKLRSNDRFNPGYPGLLTHNIIDRYTYAYRGFYIDAVRGVDALLTLPEVDTDRIGVHGSSQGGALTVVISALRNDVVTCGAAGAPYLTAFLDSAKLTRSYPYEEINEYLRMFPDQYEAVRDSLAYFDCINFAPDVRCPMLVYIGLEDDVCPPETGYALARAMTAADVTLHAHEGCAHDAGIRWEGAMIRQFLGSRLQPGNTVTGDDE